MTVSVNIAVAVEEEKAKKRQLGRAKTSSKFS